MKFSTKIRHHCTFFCVHSLAILLTKLPFFKFSYLSADRLQEVVRCAESLKGYEGYAHRASVPTSTYYPNPDDGLTSSSRQQETGISEGSGEAWAHKHCLCNHNGATAGKHTELRLCNLQKHNVA